MAYLLTDEQFKALKDYFDLAMTAISDDEQAELVFMEPALRNMLRGIETTFKP